MSKKLTILMLMVTLTLLLSACGVEPLRQYNREPEQDKNCLNSVFGRHGYCGKYNDR